jgi:hypothetical protein
MNRFADRGWTFFPRPNQLYSVELVMDLADAWAVECKNSFQIAKLPFYKNSEYVGHHDQIAYRTWLIDGILVQPTDHWRSLSRLFSEGVLNESDARSRFPANVVERALRVAGLTPVSVKAA